MNQQWLTILLSKGIELEQSIRQQVQSATEQIKSQVKKKFEERGVRLSPVDLAAMTEELFPNTSNAALSYALDVMRPFSAGMGLRISRLSDNQVEMVCPARTRNMTEGRELHEGALITAGVEAAKLLWMRHAPLEGFEIRATKVEAEFFKTQKEECRLRMALSEQEREAILASLRSLQKAQAQSEVHIFDESEQTIGVLRLQLEFQHQPQLS